MAEVPHLDAPTVGREPIPGRGIPRIDDTVSTEALGAPLARGLDTLDQESQRLRAQHDQLRVIDASTQLEAARNALLYGKRDPATGTQTGGAFALRGMDAINLPGKFMPEYRKIADRIGETLTPEQKRMFSAHVAAGSNELNVQLNRYEHEQSNQLADEIFKNSALQSIDSAALGWRDPLAIGKGRADLKALASAQGDREGWTPEIRNERTKALIGELHTSVIDRMLADGDLPSAVHYYAAAKDELTPERAKVLENHLASEVEAGQRRWLADDERKTREYNRVQKEAGDEAAKQLDRIDPRKLTADDIEKSRDLLSEADYRHFYDVIRNPEKGQGAAPADPLRAADLRDRAGRGEDVRDDARLALQQGAIRYEDYKTVLGEVESERPGWYKQGSNAIKAASGYSEINPNPAHALAMNAALDDWNEWAADHPKPSPKEAMDARNAIILSHHFAGEAEEFLAMPKPRFLVGTRNEPDLAATAQRTAQALQNGEIDEATARKEAVIWKQWHDFFEQRAAAAGAGGQP